MRSLRRLSVITFYGLVRPLVDGRLKRVTMLRVTFYPKHIASALVPPAP